MHSPTADSTVTSTGDGNGFEVSPSNADDGVFAVDINSGNRSSRSCTSSRRDRHDFYDYGLSVPGGSLITGIEVRLDALVDKTSRNPTLCVQLSWDGGNTWTTAQQTPDLTTSEATYLLGGSVDTWGRTWTEGDLSDANFRLRVGTTARSRQRDFSLDWVAVQVHHRQAVPGEITLSATPTSRSITEGESTNYTVDITRLDGLSGDVTLWVSGLGAGATTSFSANPVAGDSSVLTISTTSGAATGTRTLTISGTGGGSIATTTVTLEVESSHGCQGQCS